MRRVWCTAIFIGILAAGALPVARATSPPGRGADRDADKVFDDLERALEGAEGRRVDVIALFTGGRSAEKVADARRDVGAFQTKYEYRSMPGFAASLTPGQVRSLAARSDVLQLELDAELEYQMDSARAAAGIDAARVDFPSEDGNDETSTNCPGLREYCKDDVVIAIVDSGLDRWHVDLDGGKVLGGIDCSDATCDGTGWTLDTDRHGTAVAAVAAGDGDGNPNHVGVAPGAALVGVKVGGTVNPTVASVDAGLEWVLANKDTYGIDIANMSLSSTTPSDGTNSTSRLSNRLVASGITVFASGGNGNPEPGKTGFPAAAEHVVAVGNMADTGVAVSNDGAGFVLSLGSKRGPTLDGRVKPDILSHGIDVTAASAHTTNGYQSNSGTSFSSPFAAGVGALMLDANPGFTSSGTLCPAGDVTPDCADGVVDATMSVPVKQTMTATAEDWGGAGKDSEYGAGRLDGYAAVDAASSAEGNGGPAGPAHAHFAGTLAGSGSSATHPIEVTSTGYAVTAALIMKDRAAGATTPNFDLSILDSGGRVVAQSAFPDQNHRQENASFRPTATGTYSVVVKSTSGGGTYWLDVSFPGTEGPPPPPPTPTPTPTPAPPPGTPSGLTAAPVAGSTSSIDLAWQDVSDETSYEVERSLDGSTGWTKIATTAANATTYRNTGLAAATTYHYRVRAANASARSDYSNVASGTTNADTTPPSAPANLKAAAGKGQATISWSASSDTGSGVGGYRLYRATASTGPFTLIRTTTALSVLDYPVTKGKTYWYYVVAFDNAGNASAPSATVSVRPT